MNKVIPHDDQVTLRLEKVLKECSYFFSKDKNSLIKNKKLKSLHSNATISEISIAEKFDTFFEKSESLCSYIQNLYELTKKYADYETSVPLFPAKDNCAFAVAGWTYIGEKKTRLNPFENNLSSFLYSADSCSAEYAVAREQLLIDVLLKLCIECGKNKTRNRKNFIKNEKFDPLIYMRNEKLNGLKEQLHTTALKAAKERQSAQLFPSIEELFKNNINLQESLSKPENIILALKIEPLLLKTRLFSRLIRQIPFDGQQRFSFIGTLFREQRIKKADSNQKFSVMKAMLFFKAFEPELFDGVSNIDKIAAHVLNKEIFNSRNKLETLRKYIALTY